MLGALFRVLTETEELEILENDNGHERESLISQHNHKTIAIIHGIF